MNRRSGPGPTSLAVPSGAPAPSGSSQDVALRHLAHARAAQGGSGSNTEMRAILRKEREMERARASSSMSNRGDEQPTRRVVSNSSSLTTSVSDRKLTQTGSNSSLGAPSTKDTDDGQDPPRPQPAKSAVQPAAMPVNAHRQQSSASDREGSASSASSRVPPPPESFDHSFGIDALQAAFSAKYYELANKCKNWERYAAKLRAQSEVVEVENRVLREQMAQLEAENASLRHEQQQRDQDHYRRDVDSRLASLEELLPNLKIGDSVHARGQTVDTFVDLDNISAPSAPSSASKSSDGRHGGQTYCSSNLQVEDRPELRPPTPVSALSLPSMLPSVPPQDAAYHNSAVGRRSLNHAREASHEWPAYNKRDSASLAEIINQDAANRDFGALYGEGRSSRLGSRRIESDASASVTRSAFIPASATFPPGPQSVANDPSALTSQALAAMNRHHAAMLGGGRAAVSRSSMSPDLLGKPAPTTGKRRSTISVERSAVFGSQLPGGPTAYQASAQRSVGTDARSRGPSSLSDAPTVTGSHLQEYVEQRRQQRKTSFTAQQQQQQQNVALLSGQPASRPASRLSNHSTGGDRTRRARSRASSVHDAIPMLKDDVFSDGAVAPGAPLGGPSPLGENLNVLNEKSLYASSVLGASSPSLQAQERSALMELRCSQPMLASDTSQSSHSLHSGIADYSNSSTDLSDGAEDQRRAHRMLYANLRNELDSEDLVKFEKYVHRYDALEIGLDGPRGLINRVKKLLLLTDPDLKSKPEKLRVRKELAREFEKVVKSTTA